MAGAPMVMLKLFDHISQVELYVLSCIKYSEANR